jgi:nucleoid DNA-binding protein
VEAHREGELEACEREGIGEFHGGAGAIFQQFTDRAGRILARTGDVPLGFAPPFAYRARRARTVAARISLFHEVQSTVMAKAKKSARKPAKKPAPKSAAKAVKGVLNKSALVQHLAGTSGAAAKDVRAVLAALEGTIQSAIGKKGARVFVLPGLLKITVTNVPAKPARKGVNPFTGEPTTFKAKPASVKVKVRPMKKLKDAAKA